MNPRAVPGHNGGPDMTPGFAGRRYAWKRARAALLPRTMPLEVVRMRVRRAAELGLDVRTYASLRAATGHDIVALLFSSNALLMLGEKGASPERAERLAALVNCRRSGLAIRPVSAPALARAVPALDTAHPAPPAFAPWAVQRAHLDAAHAGSARDRVLLIGDTAEERGWAAAGRLAGYLPAESYFAARTAR